jgi:hypothetical protein
MIWPLGQAAVSDLSASRRRTRRGRLRVELTGRPGAAVLGPCGATALRPEAQRGRSGRRPARPAHCKPGAAAAGGEPVRRGAGPAAPTRQAQDDAQLPLRRALGVQAEGAQVGVGAALGRHVVCGHEAASRGALPVADLRRGGCGGRGQRRAEIKAWGSKPAGALHSGGPGGLPGGWRRLEWAPVRAGGLPGSADQGPAAAASIRPLPQHSAAATANSWLLCTSGRQQAGGRQPERAAHQGRRRMSRTGSWGRWRTAGPARWCWPARRPRSLQRPCNLASTCLQQGGARGRRASQRTSQGLAAPAGKRHWRATGGLAGQQAPRQTRQRTSALGAAVQVVVLVGQLVLGLRAGHKVAAGALPDAQLVGEVPARQVPAAARRGGWVGVGWWWCQSAHAAGGSAVA